MKADICDLAEIPSAGTLRVDFFGRPLHVLMTSEGRPVAYADVCMHFGGPLECSEDGTLTCAWHGARFHPDTGSRLDGPAAPGARLMRLSTVVEEGKLRYVWAE